MLRGKTNNLLHRILIEFHPPLSSLFGKLFQRLHRIIIRFLRHHRSPKIYIKIIFYLGSRYLIDATHTHFIVRNCTSFIHTQNIHARQGFDTMHIMHQNFFLCQTYRRQNQCHGRKQEQPLRNHPHYRRNHRLNTHLYRRSMNKILLTKH